SQPRHRILHRHDGGVETIVVAQQAGAGLQNVAMERCFGQRKVVEGPERRVVFRRIRVDPAQQQPSEQREQQQYADGTQRQSHGGAAPCVAPARAVTGAPLYLPVSVLRNARIEATCSSVSVRSSWARPIARTASASVAALPS